MVSVEHIWKYISEKIIHNHLQAKNINVECMLYGETKVTIVYDDDICVFTLLVVGSIGERCIRVNMKSESGIVREWLEPLDE